MTYSIYRMVGYYGRGKFIVGGFKNLNNAKDRCVEILRTYSPLRGKLEIVNSTTKKTVGWMYNEHAGEQGYFFEDLKGNFKLYKRW